MGCDGMSGPPVLLLDTEPSGRQVGAILRSSPQAGGGGLPMEAFDDVYRRHLPVVLRAAARVVGRRDVAEEITADAFLELYRQFDRIDLDRLPGWLLTVVRNRGIDYWRKQQTERLFSKDVAGVEPMSEAEAPAVGLFSHAALKPIHRVCLILRYEHGLSREEIARRLGLTDTQVRGHLQYALTLLRKHLVAQAG